MPYNHRPRDIHDFIPDADFDTQRDLIRVDLEEDQTLFVSNLNGVWGIAQSDPSISLSMLTRYHELRNSGLDSTPGIRVDSAIVGSFALFSAANFDWKNIYKSANVIKMLTPCSRESVMESTVVLIANDAT